MPNKFLIFLLEVPVNNPFERKNTLLVIAKNN